NPSPSASSNAIFVAPPKASMLLLFGGSAGTPAPLPRPRPAPPRPPAARPAPPRAPLAPAYAVSAGAGAAAGGVAATAVPICARNLPSRENLRIRVSLPPLPAIQTLPFASTAIPLGVVGQS